MTLLGRLLHGAAPPPPPDDLIHWDEAYSVGNALLDNEHRDIVAVLNDLYRGRSADGRPLDPEHTLARLRDVAEVHFANEEAVLARHRCPRLDSHQSEHRVLWSELSTLAATMPAMDADTRERALASMLRKIVLGHILVADMRDQDYLRE